jgi:radical SAM-linked protein
MSRPGPAGPPPPPVAQRLVIRYAKRGRMRFASHRDIARAMERGVRRAGLPIAYSAGFSPHPRISYAGGAQTGTASEAEYLEIALTGPCAASDVRDRLDAALPSGIDVIEVFEMTSGPSAGRLDALGLEASEWEVTLPGVSPADAARAVEVFLGAGTAEVERLTSKGTRRLDARAAVVLLEAGERAAAERDAACAILRMVVRHLTPAVRPDDILTALRQLAGLVPSSPPLVTRLAQGPLGMEAAAAPAPGTSGRGSSAGPAGAAAGASPPIGRGVGQVQTTRLGAVPAVMAGAAPANAYDQLLRGAGGPETGLRAREPDGRLPGCSRSSHRIEKMTVTGQDQTARPLT